MIRPDRAWTRSGLDATAFDALARALPSAEVWSLLLDVMDQRARQRAPADLLRQWERDVFTRPCPIDQRTLVALDGHLLAAAHAFEPIELSPVAPLGACSVIGLASQNKLLSALRGTEIVADPTNVLALECARRLRADPTQTVRLATCHRCLRSQAVPRRAGFAQHFRIFCLATAARERENHACVVDALAEHVTTHVAALDRLTSHGYAFGTPRLRLLATDARAELADRVAASIAAVAVERAPLDHAYYDGLRFTIDVDTPSGEAVPLIDGGAFNWLGRLTSNRRLVFVASGMGAQLAAALFRR